MDAQKIQYHTPTTALDTKSLTPFTVASRFDGECAKSPAPNNPTATRNCR
ncbi:MAG: hypothetical protein N2689_02860 [Verrucomicrobiae bacterium]|nr:hypothetical protein [Verrucomicrobiae bacterium]